MEGMTKFMAVGWDFPPSLGFPINVFGVKWCIIVGDNPAGNWFVLRDLVPTSFFK